MRIKINFKFNKGLKLPIEYNFEIYGLLKSRVIDFLKKNKPKVSKRFEKELPDFTFSQLMIPQRSLEYGFIIIKSDYMSLFVSSFSKDFIEYVYQSFNYFKEIRIYDNNIRVRNVEIVNTPEFESDMRFKMLSPSVFIKRTGNKIKFVKPFDSELNDIFRKSIEIKLEKYDMVFDDFNINIGIDQQYAEKNRVLTKLINVNNVNYRAIYSPITLSGNSDLIKFCYESGIGFNTFYGFGMLGI